MSRVFILVLFKLTTTRILRLLIDLFLLVNILFQHWDHLLTIRLLRNHVRAQ
jgi:hypothetical protein